MTTADTPSTPPPVLSVNAGAMPLVHRLLAQAAALEVTASEDASGITLIDAGLSARGSIAAGLLVGEICMGGLGEVGIAAGGRHGWPLWLEVHSAQPVLACLASQYAGWSLSASKEETGGRRFFSLGSGPARALAAKEPLFAELGYRDQAEAGVLVLEVDRLPPQVIVDKLLRDCGLAADALTVIITPTTSATGTTQVVARVLEVAMHRAHALGFALTDIVEGSASAPLPAPSPDGVVAMGRTNDAILYGGQVQLSVRGSDEAARALARQLPSRNSPDFGKPFAQLFTDAGFDFYKLDPGLFAPAEVWVSNLDSGNTWHAGAIDMPLLHRQWLQAA
jgi:methenyltetrahydromethanopterin cyclohydrolase